MSSNHIQINAFLLFQRIALDWPHSVNNLELSAPLVLPVSYMLKEVQEDYNSTKIFIWNKEKHFLVKGRKQACLNLATIQNLTLSPPSKCTFLNHDEMISSLTNIHVLPNPGPTSNTDSDYYLHVYYRLNSVEFTHCANYHCTGEISAGVYVLQQIVEFDMEMPLNVSADNFNFSLLYAVQLPYKNWQLHGNL